MPNQIIADYLINYEKVNVIRFKIIIITIEIKIVSIRIVNTK